MAASPARGSAHLVLTRFSVRPYDRSAPYASDWLDYRLELFEAYCLPAIAAQTMDDFAWLVLCDESTDERCLRRLKALARDLPQLSVELTCPGRSSIPMIVDRARTAGSVVMITTRVDSDDASSLDMVERIQSYCAAFVNSARPSYLLNFPHGYKLHEAEGTLHETWNPHSPHLTLFERLDAEQYPTTVQAGNHGFMQERHPLHLDAGPPTWLQVVHGGNVSNTMVSTDRPVASDAIAERFRIRRRAGARTAVAAPQPEDADARTSFRQALEESLLGGGSGPGSI